MDNDFLLNNDGGNEILWSAVTQWNHAHLSGVTGVSFGINYMYESKTEVNDVLHATRTSWQCVELSVSSRDQLFTRCGLDRKLASAYKAGESTCV